MTRLPFKFRAIIPSKSFKKDYQNLPEQAKAKVDSALREIKSGNLPRSRNLKKLSPKQNGIFQIYLSAKDYRLTFKEVEGNLLLLRVGSHRTVEGSF